MRVPRLNDLPAKEWIKFTKSWFVLEYKRDAAQTTLHPASFPVELPAAFIEFFTRSGQSVFDPFAGSGAALSAACTLGRAAAGVELEQRFAEFARGRAPDAVVRIGDSAALLRDRTLFPDGSVDYCFTSPPYWNALSRSRGGNSDTRHKDRAARGESVVYGTSPYDLGNIDDPDDWLDRLVDIFRSVYRILRQRAYCTVVLQNLNISGLSEPVAWRFALAMVDTGLWGLKGEKIWCQDKRKLGIYGYPWAYATNNFHHYCLTFRRLSL